MPTPKSSIDDDPTRTPRFTPAYKYNKWDSNRASGATPKPGKGKIQKLYILIKINGKYLNYLYNIKNLILLLSLGSYFV